MTISVRTMQAKAVQVFGTAALLLIGAGSALAQKPEARIVLPVQDAVRATLEGSKPAIARSDADAGRMPATAKIEGASIIFSRSAAQQAALDTLLAAQQDTNSPQYHQWLTPDVFAAQYGAADADIAKVQTWLQGQGLTVTGVGGGRDRITFTGTVAQIEAAFATEMHYFKGTSLTGAVETHFAPNSNLSVPAAFAGTVMAVGNLSDLRPRSHMTKQAPVNATPNFTSNQTGSHFVTPKDVSTIYDINAAYNSGWTGYNQKIAVLGQSAVVTSDITNFQTAAGVPVRAPTQVLVAGSGVSTVYTGDESESDLDLEYTSGIAKGASIFFVYTGSAQNYGVFDSLAYAVQTPSAFGGTVPQIISMSYGLCEQALGTYYSVENATLQQAAAQGQSVVVSSGDAGSTDCSGESGLTSTVLTNVAVDFPASSQYVTAMGGTEYLAADVAASASTYWQAAAGSDVIGSALQYIPEMVWNDDSAPVTTSSGTTGGLSSGGGGISTETPLPSWQTGVTGIPAGSFRFVPDISLASSPNNAGYLYCSSDTSTGVTGSCTNGFRNSANTSLTVAGGTSFAAPIFAGMLALINQSRGVTTGAGLVNPTLYKLAANTATYASAFHDITTGNNYCLSGATLCSTASTTTYAATTGYDLATGLGSIDLNNLLTAWPGTTAVAAKFTIAVAAAAITDGNSGTVTITVTPSNGYTGTVAFSLTTQPLLTNTCYTTSNVAVTGTAAVITTATINTSATACTTNTNTLSQKGTGATASATTPAQPGSAPLLPLGGTMAGLLAIGVLGRRSRRLRGLVLMAMLAVAGFGLTGCGSGSTSGAGIVTTPASTIATKGSYTVYVTGADTTTGASAATTFTLTIQ